MFAFVFMFVFALAFMFAFGFGFVVSFMVFLTDGPQFLSHTIQTVDQCVFANTHQLFQSEVDHRMCYVI